jgi:carboxyl-terminal processing protease
LKIPEGTILVNQHHTHTTAVPARRIPTVIIVLAFVFVAGVGYIAGTQNAQIIGAALTALGQKTYTGTLDLSDVQATYQTLKANYDGELDEAALIEGASRGLVEAVGDEYTSYLNSTEADEFQDSLAGTIGGGIGVELGIRNDLITVLRILRDNPAEKSGVQVGDVVVGVNDETNNNWTLQDAVSRIRGEAGTTVKLKLLRGTETKEFRITRAEITNPSVYSEIKDGIGIMTITRFDSETGALARQAAQNFKDKKVRGVILDLRGNGGGYVTAAQEVASLWLDNRVIVSERANGEVIDELRSGSRPILGGIKTAVLVNESSASASEIVAGALQDYEVAELVGATTFGKGSVQKLVSLPGGAELKVTIARWYTPDGRNIGEEGITPEVSSSMTAEDINAGRDPQLKAAQSLFE